MIIRQNSLPSWALLLLFGFLPLSTSTEDMIVQSIEKDMEYNDNGKLYTHHLFYPGDSPNCPAAQAEAYGMEFTPLAGEALRSVFPAHTQRSGCPVACAERGTDRGLAHAIMPHKIHLDLSNALKFQEWLNLNCQRVDVCLINYYSEETPVLVYWISPDDSDDYLQLELDYGEQNAGCFGSQLGHKFEVLDGDTEEVIDDFVVEYALFRVIGEAPSFVDDTDTDYEGEIEHTLLQEWERHKRIQRTFTPNGFKKGRLPDDVFASMGAFYYNNRQNYATEDWVGSGVYVNWWQVDCYFVLPPNSLKLIWQARLKALVQTWAGVEIEQTDMYGIRMYAEGARLLTHVDRESTHAVSLIVNVAQGNLSQPWKVEIHDHENRLHEVSMEPGGIVYYESAKCLHGRNRPLTGESSYYVNLFTHYRPIGDPNWYTKSNPGEPDQGEGTGTQGVCNEMDGPADGPLCDNQGASSIKPTPRFKAYNGDDLIRWWRLTGEQEQRFTTHGAVTD